jgi:hypothetical protein
MRANSKLSEFSTSYSFSNIFFERGGGGFLTSQPISSSVRKRTLIIRSDLARLLDEKP